MTEAIDVGIHAQCMLNEEIDRRCVSFFCEFDIGKKMKNENWHEYVRKFFAIVVENVLKNLKISLEIDFQACCINYTQIYFFYKKKLIITPTIQNEQIFHFFYILCILNVKNDIIKRAKRDKEKRIIF